MVDKGPEHRIEIRESWSRDHGGEPPRAVPASTTAILDRIRASRNRWFRDPDSCVVENAREVQTRLILSKSSEAKSGQQSLVTRELDI